MKNNPELRFKALLTLSIYLGAMSTVMAESEPDKNSAPWVGETLVGATCTGKGQGPGPYDYAQRLLFRSQLEVVEKAHFVSSVRDLIKGNRGSLVADIDYTLRAWPNHHQALASISKYQFLHEQSSDGRYRQKPFSPVECYFHRAIHFSSEDAITHMLFAIYLHKSGHSENAELQYQKALEISPDNRSIHYNYGLLLVSLKKYELAHEHAEKAYQAGYPLQGLKNKLIKVGQWKQSTKPAPDSEE